ncbi:ATP-binding cassette domain-containing protein [Gordonia sp. ABSL1-1]|uniref:ABC transporter ATP-binding protein n=1 Tax=Gordonia sp. ABSL1-1 TaxID=3053923 RepID=UPI002573B2CB|nr:ATP-binding cassette domain-containing protein [Gordonia sp. ABSL1-1]MDL9935515.1 ATP-binding cassette domain-containing protein [Gordonia sp. ABSL1-1]
MTKTPPPAGAEPEARSEPSIVVDRLTKHFGKKAAADDVSFVAAPGAITYLLGPNGAGKTTVMRMIAGFTRPDRGTISINGGRLGDFRDVRREIGFSLNPFANNPKHTALRHLRWQARLAGVPVADADRVLDLVGLTGVATRQVGGFSFGMLQRLGIATALLGDPHTIVLDEPANGLDVEGTLWLRDTLTGLANAGKCLLVASHNLAEVEITASRIIIMGRGKVLADDDRHTILARGSGPRLLESAYLDLTKTSVDYSGSSVTR